MRSIWKGSVAFGLVNVPVRLYSATEDRDVKFHQVHGKDGGKIRYQRICELDGEVVPFAEIEKAYNSEDGQTIVLSAEDFASLPSEEDREIAVQSFVPTEQVDALMYDKAYYLEPAGKSAKPYQLLLETLEKTDRLAIVSFALRQKTRLAALRVRDGILVLQTLLWPDEVREAEFPSLDEPAKLSPAEKKMATMLVDSFADDFHPENFTDSYRAELQQLIDAKLEGGEAFPTKTADDEGEDAEVVDLLAALERSVAKRKEAESGSVTTKKTTPAKKAAGAKSTAARAKAADQDDEEDEDEKPARRRSSKAG